jgi:hypothetical protein
MHRHLVLLVVAVLVLTGCDRMPVTYTAARSRPHFLLMCLDRILPFCSFFRRLANFVAGFLAIRLSFFAITGLLVNVQLVEDRK